MSIDRSLNYGRHLIRQYLEMSMPFHSVLDLGAGLGADLNIASTLAPSTKRLAVEVHSAYASKLRALGMSVYEINIEKDALPFPDASIDVIIANQVLEHTKDIFWIFHEVTRVLRRGGKLIIGVPNLASLHNRILLAAGRHPTPIKMASAHVRGFTKRDLIAFISCCFPAGYSLRAFGGSNFYPFPPTLAKPLARIWPALAWGIFLLLEKQNDYCGEFLKFPIMESLETNYYLGPQNLK